ncbi:MAG: MerR family transcriptional regulator [Alphaproteobacteria bacterium]|nr:MerR family transcriptional regulator [Alphaproteobacteria bacterium]
MPVSEDPALDQDRPKVQKSASAFRTISEVADDMDIPQHVLRFWETKFTQVRPLKRGGGRRYYRPEDVATLKRIHHLLYTEGYTIKGVQKLLKGQGRQQIVNAQVASVAPVFATESKIQPPADQADNTAVTSAPGLKRDLSDTQRVMLELMLDDLKSLRQLVDMAA